MAAALATTLFVKALLPVSLPPQHNDIECAGRFPSAISYLPVDPFDAVQLAHAEA
jgi:hypothetical protein